MNNRTSQSNYLKYMISTELQHMGKTSRTQNFINSFETRYFRWGKWSHRRVTTMDSDIIMSINSKERYLEFRECWKADYKELSEAIRKAKFEDVHTERDYIKLDLLRELATTYLIILAKAKEQAYLSNPSSTSPDNLLHLTIRFYTGR